MADLFFEHPTTVLVLTNLAQSLIHATDVVLLGRVGPFVDWAEHLVPSA